MQRSVQPPPKFGLGLIRACSGAALLFLLGSSVSWGQQKDSAPPHSAENFEPPVNALFFSAENDGSWTFHKRVNEVTLFFTATDRHHFVQGLVLDDIRVYDDHQPVARISAFQHQLELPLRIGLVVDTSGSVNPRFRFEQQSAIQFLRQIVRKHVDSAFVMGFSDHVRFAQDYSDDSERLASGVMALRNGGGTALFDAIRTAGLKLAAVQPEQQPHVAILIVLSDGEDNASKTSLKQALDVANSEDVTIYTINTRIESIEPRLSNGSAAGDAILKRLAEQTGGRFFSHMSATGVARAFSSIEEEIRNRFVVSYQPQNLVEDGRFRPVQIIVERAGRRYHVHARKGYYTRLAPTEGSLP